MSAGQSVKPRSSSSSSKLPDGPSESAQVGVEACAATASIFLFAQGKTIVCLHHDSLAVERRFEKHSEPVVFLVVDNVSERGAGRLVASSDVGQTTIIWDLFTGDELARFASYEALTVAAWMSNGNIAFGESMHLSGRGCADGTQRTFGEKSSTLNRRHRNTSRPGPFSTPSKPWHRALIAPSMQLGE